MRGRNVIIVSLICICVGVFLGRKGRVLIGFTKEAFGKGSFNKIIDEISKEQKTDNML